MEKIDMQSALKAGAIAAGVAIVINILALIPFIGGFFSFISICGGIFIPIAGGMMYGYFAEGKEDTQTAAIGGAIAGGASGLIFAILGAVLGTVSDGLAAGIATGLISSICLGLFGFALGALGGVLWPLIQDNVSGAK